MAGNMSDTTLRTAFTRNETTTLRPESPVASYWLFSPATDLAAFLGSAVASLLLLWLGAEWNILHDDAPDWTWVSVVLLVDVAHVYATAFRVYFDAAEFQRRRWLYVLTPLLAFLIGAALYSEGEAIFWRALAYLAVFHFVRQQYGWVALYRSKRGETGWLGWTIDSAAIYAATVYPLIYWHTHLPRNFWWFVAGDFSGLSPAIDRIAAPIYGMCLAIYVVRALIRGIFLRRFNPGKDIVVTTTALCWFAGIVAINSDYAFTVSTVIIHGAPYIVLIFFYWNARRTSPSRADRAWSRVLIFVATIWLLAYVEELFWDRGVWHDRGWLFGSGWEPGRWKALYVALLAVPQMTHYVLDGFIWRRRSNPRLSRFLS